MFITCYESIKQCCFDLWCCTDNITIKDNIESPMNIERERESIGRSINFAII